MKDLPPILRKAPLLFYILAAVVFLGQFVPDFLAVRSATDTYGDAFPSPGGLLIDSFLDALINASFLVANAILFEMLIAFWDRFAGDRKDDGGSE